MEPIKLIAEIAQGFEGKPDQAAMLIQAAAAAGADAVKLQLIYADELCTSDYKHYALFASLEMADQVWMDLHKLAATLGVELYLDVFGERSLRMSEQLKVAGVKVHSTDMANVRLLKMIGKSQVERVMLSAGGCHTSEIVVALEIMASKHVILMHGFQGYPTRIEDNQLSRLRVLRKIGEGHSRLDLGYADHVPSDDPLRFIIPSIAIGLGVRYVEKHITLALAMKIEDHESALNPDEFATFSAQLRSCELAYASSGSLSEDFAMSQSELAYRKGMHKHVVAARDLAAGTVISEDMVSLKRTSSNNPYFHITEVIGRRLASPAALDQALTSANLGEDK